MSAKNMSIKGKISYAWWALSGLNCGSFGFKADFLSSVHS